MRELFLAFVCCGAIVGCSSTQTAVPPPAPSKPINVASYDPVLVEDTVSVQATAGGWSSPRLFVGGLVIVS